MKKFDLLCLGEALLRLSPPDNERLTENVSLVRHLGGAELNVAAGAAMLGIHTGMISVLPDHALGKYATAQIRSMGVADEFLLKDSSKDARLGLYYYETGAAPRKPAVVYDRRHSSIYSLSADAYPEEMYRAAKCFHVSGITLALDENVREQAVKMLRRFKKTGTLISFDVNFRENLWSGQEAKTCIEEILPFVDIFFCSESTARLTFQKKGELREILKSFTREYPIKIVAATERKVYSPKCHRLGSLVYDRERGFFEEKPYDRIEVVDRIGSGDAYISGFLTGLLEKGGNVERAVSFGNGAGALKETVPGDMLYTSREELLHLIETHKGKTADMEMQR